MQIGIIGAALALGSMFYGGGRRAGKSHGSKIRGRQGSIIVDEYAGIERRARSPRLGRRQRNFGIVHVVSIKPETKRARRRRLGRERGGRHLAYAQHLARCGK